MLQKLIEPRANRPSTVPLAHRAAAPRARRPTSTRPFWRAETGAVGSCANTTRYTATERHGRGRPEPRTPALAQHDPGEDDRDQGLGLLQDEGLREDLVRGRSLEGGREQDRRDRLRARGDDADREPSARPEVAQLARAADEDRQEEQGDQRILGDHDLGGGEVTDELVAEVSVRSPQCGGDGDKDHREPVDADAACRGNRSLHRRPFNRIRPGNLPTARPGHTADLFAGPPTSRSPSPSSHRAS